MGFLNRGKSTVSYNPPHDLKYGLEKNSTGNIINRFFVLREWKGEHPKDWTFGEEQKIVNKKGYPDPFFGYLVSAYVSDSGNYGKQLHLTFTDFSKERYKISFKLFDQNTGKVTQNVFDIIKKLSSLPKLGYIGMFPKTRKEEWVELPNMDQLSKKDLIAKFGKENVVDQYNRLNKNFILSKFPKCTIKEKDKFYIEVRNSDTFKKGDNEFEIFYEKKSYGKTGLSDATYINIKEELLSAFPMKVGDRKEKVAHQQAVLNHIEKVLIPLIVDSRAEYPKEIAVAKQQSTSPENNHEEHDDTVYEQNDTVYSGSDDESEEDDVNFADTVAEDDLPF